MNLLLANLRIEMRSNNLSTWVLIVVGILWSNMPSYAIETGDSIAEVYTELIGSSDLAVPEVSTVDNIANVVEICDITTETSIADTIGKKPYVIPREERFRWTQLIAPVALITVGSIGVSNGWMCKIKRDVRDGMAKMRGDHYLHFDDYIQYLPGVGYAVVGFIPGVRHKRAFVERLCAGVTACAIMGAMTGVLKYSVREPRPDSGKRNSFPSGHTATAFTGAELMRLEYGPWIGLGAYTVATGVAFMRLYNNRHWLNDVIAGAGIGIFSAQAAYWLLPLERKLFKIKPKQAMTLVPYASPTDRSLGLAMTAIF